MPLTPTQEGKLVSIEIAFFPCQGSGERVVATDFETLRHFLTSVRARANDPLIVPTAAQINDLVAAYTALRQNLLDAITALPTIP